MEKDAGDKVGTGDIQPRSVVVVLIVYGVGLPLCAVGSGFGVWLG